MASQECQPFQMSSLSPRADTSKFTIYTIKLSFAFDEMT